MVNLNIEKELREMMSIDIKREELDILINKMIETYDMINAQMKKMEENDEKQRMRSGRNKIED